MRSNDIMSFCGQQSITLHVPIHNSGVHHRPEETDSTEE